MEIRNNDKVKKYIRMTIVIAMILIFSKILTEVFTNEINIFDDIVYNFVSKLKNDTTTKIFKIITNLGSGLAVVPITILLCLGFKDKKYGKYMIINLFLIVFLNQITKFIIQRPRPIGHRIIEQAGYSFPSGHSMVSMAFYGLLMYLIYKEAPKKQIKIISCIAIFTLILLIGISRIYLGVHYASDVLGGFCFSIAYLTIFTMISKDKLLNTKKE